MNDLHDLWKFDDEIFLEARGWHYATASDLAQLVAVFQPIFTSNPICLNFEGLPLESAPPPHYFNGDGFACVVGHRF